MDVKEFIENFANQFDDTEASEFTVDSKFKELDEWSSLTALSIIAMIDEEYDVTLKGDDIQKTETIQDVIDLVESRKA
jgi:acyl carrier protein